MKNKPVFKSFNPFILKFVAKRVSSDIYECESVGCLYLIGVMDSNFLFDGVECIEFDIAEADDNWWSGGRVMPVKEFWKNYEPTKVKVREFLYENNQ